MQYDMDASEWLNTPEPLRLSALRGRVVVVSAFQMLCRGCAEHSLPQAAKLHQAFAREDLVVIGLHSVFEHHAVMTPDALRAFVHEYRLGFPIAIDRPQSHSALPATMQAWGLRGTPSLMLFGRDGVLAYEHFGHLDDLRLGMVLGELLAHSAPKATAVAAAAADSPAAPVCRIN